MEHLLKHNHVPFIIDTATVVVPDTTVQRHDGRYDSVDFFDGFFFVRLDVSRRVLLHDDVARHPLEDGIAAVDDVPFHKELVEFLRRWRHILVALAERHDGKAHVLQVLDHLCCVPSVEGNLADVVYFAQVLDELLDEAIVDDVPFRRLDVALSFPHIVKDVVPPAAEFQRILWQPEERQDDVFLVLRPWRKG